MLKIPKNRHFEIRELFICILIPINRRGKDVLPFKSAPSFKQNNSAGTEWIGKHIFFHFDPMLTPRAVPQNFRKSNKNNYISKFLL